MAHVRQQLRERAATTLTGLTTTGSRVYQSRIYPLGAANLPGLLIYTKSEASEPETNRQCKNGFKKLIISGRWICKGSV